MFQLSKEETESLRFQIGTSKRGGRRYLPYVFTQEGVAMLSSALNSPRAIQVNIQIMRAFVKLRRMLLTNRDLRRKIEAMEKKYDRQFSIVFEAIKQLLEPPKQTRAVGFRSD
jgi:phage regulator Rha-like protein